MPCVRTCEFVEFNQLAAVIICKSDGRVPHNKALADSFSLNQRLFPPRKAVE